MNKKRIYLINPQNPENFWAMQGTLTIVGKKTLMPNAALLTLIALTPKDLPIEYVFCDENIEPIDWNITCDLVGLTGFTLQFERMKYISSKFRSQGIPIAAGGIYATIDPESVQAIADYLFIGEAEHTWPQFLREWISGKTQSLYKQETHIDMHQSPSPDLSYINGEDYLYFTVQTSRGCPNSCDFCDVIRVHGRRYRSKTVEQIMQEVRNAQAAGAETIFFSDDNFYVNRPFTISLLKEIIAWNTQLPSPMSFSTQATIQIGADHELLKLMADARFRVVFIGLETINKECLKEVNKGQMIPFDPFEVIPRISSYGIVPFLGMIVGFDHDTPNIFREIETFLEETGSPIASISVLNAPKNTPLYEKMKKENRILEDFRGFWHLTSNILPKHMDANEFYSSHRNLFRKIYEPELFEARLIDWMKNVSYFSNLYSTSRKHFFRFFLILRILLHFLFRVPPKIRSSFFRVLKAAWKIDPRLISRSLSIYVQYWHYYEFSHKENWQKAGERAAALITSLNTNG